MFYALLQLLAVSLRVQAVTTTPNTGDQQQGFFFGFPSPGLPNNLILPEIPSCPGSLTLSGLTSTNNPNLPDSASPYTMIMLVHEQYIGTNGTLMDRTYSKSLNVGQMTENINIATPWMNGTQMIACIWDQSGISGGCQDLMTVIPPANYTQSFGNATTGCRDAGTFGSWWTDPSKTLDVRVEGPAGDISSNAWPATCSDIRVTPRNGTAPYTFLVAPAYHPPVNITSATQSPMNYTVKLTHGQAFMIGVYDSAGNSFAFGPLHAGISSDLTCLAYATGTNPPSTGTTVGIGALAGGIAGSFVAGLVLATLLAWFWLRQDKTRRRNQENVGDLLDAYGNLRPANYHANSHDTDLGKVVSPYSPEHVENQLPINMYDPATATNSTYHSAGDPVERHNTVRSPAAMGESNTYPSYEPETSSPMRQTTSNPEMRGIPRPASAAAGGVGPSAYAARSITRNGKARGNSGRSGSGGPPSPGAWDEEDDTHSTASGRRARNVYVVHSDGGGGDVTIRLPEPNARVIELPPNYQHELRQSSPGSASLPLRAASTSPSPAPAARPTSGLQRTASDRERMELPYLDLDLNPSNPRLSGVYENMNMDEIRARAEAAMAEKSRNAYARIGQ